LLDEAAPLEERDRVRVVRPRLGHEAFLAQPAGTRGQLAQQARADAASTMSLGHGDLDVGVARADRRGVAGEHPGADDLAIVNGKQVDVVELVRADERHHLRRVGIIREDGVPRCHPPLELGVARYGPDLDRHSSGPWKSMLAVCAS
jgi:hypothetical protein